MAVSLERGNFAVTKHSNKTTMKRYRTILAVSLLLAMVSCAKDFYSIFGLDVDAPISAKLSGSRYEWDEEIFSSSGGYYSEHNHPDLILHEDGGFTFELGRSLVCDDGKDAYLSLYVEDEDSPYELDRVYSLVILGESRATITFNELNETHKLPSGAVVSNYIAYRYEAADGYLIFTKQEEYGTSYLLSGEFRFRGVSEDGDEIFVEQGTFKNCRVHALHGDNCEGL